MECKDGGSPNLKHRDLEFLKSQAIPGPLLPKKNLIKEDEADDKEKNGCL